MINNTLIDNTNIPTDNNQTPVDDTKSKQSTNIFLANCISIFHTLVVLFVLLAPFIDIPAILILHITFSVCLLIHWWANNNICSLSYIESQLRGTDHTESFTHKFIAPIYDISKTETITSAEFANEDVTERKSVASNTIFCSPPTIIFEPPCTIKASFTKYTHLFPDTSLIITLTEIFCAAAFATLTPIIVAEVAAGDSYTLTPAVPTEPVILFLNVFAILFYL